jgi:hypothetical protein
VGIADHLGWAVAVTADAGHSVVDRRRIPLVEPGVSAAPIHYERGRLDVEATAALIAAVRASVVRACSAALDDLATALPAPVVSISLRFWPADFPDDIAVQLRPPYEARADAIMYRRLLADLARARGWRSMATTPSASRRRRPTCSATAPTMSCEARGRRSARRGRRITGRPSPRRSSPATSAFTDVSRCPSEVGHPDPRVPIHWRGRR